MKKTFTTIILILLYISTNAQAPTWAWAKGASGTGDDEGISTTTDVYGNVYLTGTYNSPSITFGTTTLTSTVGYDMFIAKLSTSTGIEESAFNTGINIFPNPTTGIVTLRSEKELRSCSIYNMLGECIYNSEINNQQSAIEIDLRKEAKGIYFIKLIDSNNNETNKKIIVQ